MKRPSVDVQAVSGVFRSLGNAKMQAKLMGAFLFLSLLIGVAVTLLTPPPPQHLVRKFFYKD